MRETEAVIRLSNAIAHARDEIRKLEQRIKDRKARLAVMENQLDKLITQKSP